MSEKLECKRCDLKFDASKVENGKCPHCRRLLHFVSDAELDPYSSSSRRLDSRAPREASFDDLVRAQNRTTYAIRSLAVYLFITITTGFSGLVLINLGRTDAAFLGAIVIITGFIWSIAAGLTELNKSKP